ncbi:zinc ion binding [Striga hermonthica]|uniref:Zinc ion binding n=1 Tax=Striga hermonthica TaxID=68872 RepID=A0A9N7MR86_STRHE|nr:zinc ion binding [Striga hermonthica]
MNSGDLNKVWEIKALKRKPRKEEAQKILEKVAKQVQPIMRKHNWRVRLLSEMCPKNPNLLGLNVGHGIHVKLRLRRAKSDLDFLPFHEVLDTMLHELCHNAHSAHNASFYKLWDELRKECEDLIYKGISGEGRGFDLPGRRLGGTSRKPLSSLRQSVLTAAQNRARLASLMPSGPKKIGGDRTIMKTLNPAQAAVMGAEKRMRDNIWCGSEFGNVLGEDDMDKERCYEISGKEFDEHIKVKSRKRNRDSDNGVNFIDLDKECCCEISGKEFDEHNKVKSRKRNQDSDNGVNFIDLTEVADEFDSMSNSKNCKKGLSGEASALSSMSGHDRANDKCGIWQCLVCTLFNAPLAPLCEACTAERPKDYLKKSIWSCRFCTLENDVKMDKCSVCGTWRYSYGPPIATGAPNRGT